MYAQEWEVGVGYGVNKVAHLVLGLIGQFVIVAAEPHDAFLEVHAVLAREAVGLQPSTHHHVLGAVALRRLVGADHRLVAVAFERRDFLAQAERTLGLLAQRQVHHLLRRRAVIDDARARYPQGVDAFAMRLDFAQLVGIDAFEAFDFILLADAMDLLEHRELAVLHCYYHLATDVVWNIVFLSEANQGASAFDTVLGFQRTGRVIQARMDDAGVVACLVIRKPGFLLNQEHGPVRIPLLQFIQRRCSYNATTHNDNVIPVACLFRFIHRRKSTKRSILLT